MRDCCKMAARGIKEDNNYKNFGGLPQQDEKCQPKSQRMSTNSCCSTIFTAQPHDSDLNMNNPTDFFC